MKGKDNFVEDSERQVGRLTKKFKGDIGKKNIKFAVKDVGSHRKRNELDENKFVAAVKEFQPTMILLAFCWKPNVGVRFTPGPGVELYLFKFDVIRRSPITLVLISEELSAPCQTLSP